MNPDLFHDPAQLQKLQKKPIKGEAYMASKDRRAERKAAEDAVMQQARKRDQGRCRWPHCTGKYRGLELPIDVAHSIHRGIGGNPAGDRTETTAQLVALCRKHHQAWDASLIDLQPLTDAGFDGPISFHEKHKESGEMRQLSAEGLRAESVARS